MAKQPPLDDLHLFRESVTDVVPLQQDRVETYRLRPAPTPLLHSQHNEIVGQGSKLSETEVITEELLYFVRPGVQTKTFVKLRQGQIKPQLELDLHGLTVVYAQESLEKFLEECRRRLSRCVRIIHGKGVRSEGGQPVLKCKVNYWLRRYDDVLAFTSAPRWDGGSGALYVLLRNPSKTLRTDR